MKASQLLQSTADPFDTACMHVLELEECLQGLIDLKNYKDQYGKDDYYNENQPLAWKRARKALQV